MKLSPEEILRAQYIARIKSGAGRDVIRDLDGLPPSQANTPVFKHIRALALTYCGALEKAAELWESLHTEGLWSEELVAGLAATYLALSHPESAEALITEWGQAHAPLSTALAESLVESLLAQQDPAKADYARQLVAQHLAHKPVVQRLAAARAAVWLEDWTGVRRILAPLAEDECDLPAAAEVLRAHGYLAESVAILTQAISVEPAVVEAWRQLATAMWQLGDEDGAMGMLADAFERFGEDPTLLESIVRICINDRDFELAARWLSRLETALGPEHAHVRTLTAEVILGLGDLQAAQELLETEKDADEAMDPARVALYTRINRPDVAIHYQDRIVSAKDRSVESLLARARLSAGAGRGTEVIALAEEVLQRLPNSLAASALLVAHRGGDVELAHLNRLRQALHGGKMPVRHRGWVSHALADYHHAVKDYDIAAELYAFCNRLNEPVPEQRYDAGRHRDWLESITATFERIPVPAMNTGNDSDEQPVFVVGMPRSGTTLTEQILSRHPRVTGMGECQHVSGSFAWLMELGATDSNSRSPALALDRCSEDDLARIRNRFLGLLRPHTAHLAIDGRHFYLDKMPDNYAHIGWIFTLFPGAKIIYARRDPREIALSCWKANFGAITWAYRMQDIADRIVQHDRAMRVWLARFGDRIFISNYADLVNDPVLQTRKMLDYLGLDWDDACLDHTLAPSIVRTASVNQVRRPVYRTSLQSWQHYEQALSPAIAAFERNGLI